MLRKVKEDETSETIEGTEGGGAIEERQNGGIGMTRPRTLQTLYIR